MNNQTDPTPTSKLMIKFLSNNLSAQEQEDFERWLAADPKNTELLESFRDTSQIQKEINFMETVDSNAGWADIQSRIKTGGQSASMWRSWMGYAAATLLFISSGIGVYYYSSNTNKVLQLSSKKVEKEDVMPGQSRAILEMEDGSSIDLKGKTLDLQDKNQSNLVGHDELTLHVPKAGEYIMILPDGSKVWLNAASTLKFPAGFNKSERRVELEGEAYFEVTHNKDLPFVVYANNTEIKVLGTRFNIENYGATSKTTLVEGSVQILASNNREMTHRHPSLGSEMHDIVLKPGQQAIVQEGNLSVAKIDVQKSVAWKEGLFYFKEDRINEILDQIARWYDVEIIYTSQPNDKRYDGTIRRQATLSQVLDMLNTVSGTRFTIKDRTVTVNFDQTTIN